MRILFAGTPQVAADQLEAILAAGFDVCAVYTQPDRPKGRGLKEIPSPVKAVALANNLPVEQPTSLKNPEALDKLAQYNPDVMIVVAYGLLLPKPVLDCPAYGCINVHLSLLPRWRGASPVQYAILKGDVKTGVTFMRMDEGLDTGDILLQRELTINATDTAESLMTRLSKITAKELKTNLQQIVEHQHPSAQNNALSTHAPKIDKHQARMVWDKTAAELDREIRAFNPWPVSYFVYHGEPVKVFRALPANNTHLQQPGTILEVKADHIVIACKQDALAVYDVQFPGKKRLPLRDIFNAKPNLFTTGHVLNDDQ